MRRNQSGKLTAAMLRERVLELRVQGLSVRAIAKQVDRSHQRVAQIIAASLDTLYAKNLETTQHMVDLEMQRLDALLATHWKRRRDPEHSNVILRIMDRRARLQGLDKPVKTEIGGFDGKPLIPPTINIGFANGGPGKPSGGDPGAQGS
jgi:hypothetical protein